MTEPAILGQGRASIVYDLGDGLVLRRYRNPAASTDSEAEAMRLARSAGVPVPEVRSAAGADLIMERVDGPTLAEQLVRRPEAALFGGVFLARLHRSLDRVRVGDAGLIHGDLHPGNVLLSPRGPVIIDWTNHRVGERATDLATTWLIVACFEPDDPALRDLAPVVRGPLLTAFLDAVDRPAAAAALPAAAAIRYADPATTDAERAAIERLVETERTPA